MCILKCFEAIRFVDLEISVNMHKNPVCIIFSHKDVFLYCVLVFWSGLYVWVLFSGTFSVSGQRGHALLHHYKICLKHANLREICDEVRAPISVTGLDYLFSIKLFTFKTTILACSPML